MVLRSIEADDLEVIRSWRNNASVNEYLITKEFISEEKQTRWFENLDPMDSMYFIIEAKTNRIGLIYANEVNVENQSFNGNIFIGDHLETTSAAPVKAVVMLFEFMFNQLSFEHVYSNINKHNTSAILMNRRMGFKTLATKGDFLTQRCGKKDFQDAMQRIKEALIGTEEIVFNFSDFDLEQTFIPLTMTKRTSG